MALLFTATDWHEDDFDPANVSLAQWEFIYERGGWEMQGSGPGSLLECNTELIEWLKNFITANNASSILDIGCGDLQWIVQVLDGMTYKGVDWVTSIINTNKQNHPTFTFSTENIMSDNFQPEYADILICKDVLQHMRLLSNDLINKIEQVNCKHKIFIIPDWMLLTDSLTGAGYTFSQTYSADEEKYIYFKST
jgi:2-polyprenyl-3-methyl-5-hydroxy-6-metoxy-1,4-benzoquinol methylase